MVIHKLRAFKILKLLMLLGAFFIFIINWLQCHMWTDLRFNIDIFTVRNMLNMDGFTVFIDRYKVIHVMV